jgi:hypothetical protein
MSLAIKDQSLQVTSPTHTERTNTQSVFKQKEKNKKRVEKHVSRHRPALQLPPLRRVLPKCPQDVAKFKHWPALVAYQIPVLAWPAVVCHPDVAIDLFDTFPHPSSTYHDHMGKVVAFALYELLLEALRGAAGQPQAALQQARDAFAPEMMHSATPTRGAQENAWAAYTADAVSRQQVEMAVKADLRSGFVASDCDQQERLTLMTARRPRASCLLLMASSGPLEKTFPGVTSLGGLPTMRPLGKPPRKN